MADDDGDWKYAIDEVGEDAADEESLERDDEEDGEAARRRIESGSPTRENVFFVALGVLIAVGTIAYTLGVL